MLSNAEILQLITDKESDRVERTVSTNDTEFDFHTWGVFKVIADEAVDNINAINVPENRLDAIICVMKNNTRISMLELSKQFNVNQKTIKRDIQTLKTKGLIERVGPDKGGYWKVVQKK